ncbi:hypothetical protein ACU4GD_25105 [Cupriavidus basilensis]
MMAAGGIPAYVPARATTRALLLAPCWAEAAGAADEPGGTRLITRAIRIAGPRAFQGPMRRLLTWLLRAGGGRVPRDGAHHRCTPG